MLLAVDTSTQWMGVALYDGEIVLGEMTWKTKRRHTVELAVSIETLLTRCGVSVTDLDVLGVALGPGSFTSLRIGLAHVKGMSLALHIPVIGIPTLDILAAAQSKDDRRLVTVLSAGRRRLAYQYYSWEDKKGWVADTDPMLATSEEMVEAIEEPVLIAGELTFEDRKILRDGLPAAELRKPADSLRRPAYLAAGAWTRFIKGEIDEAENLSPIYLHVANPIPD